jgi:hypothetical protein
MTVVVAGVGVEDVPGVGFVPDQQVVECFAPQGPDDPQWAFIRGARGAVLTASMPSAANTASREPVYFVSVCHEHGEELDVGRAT